MDRIIIHIHGGGFIGHPSKFHQTYLRQWSIELGVPVFAIDYRLAPANPYPDPLDDCL